MGNLTETAASIAMGIIGVAALAVLVSTKANTSNVLSAGGKAFSGALNAATAPVTGGGTSPGWPTPSFGASNPFGYNG